MPIRNTGTALENIVLVESARLALASSSDSTSPCEFINSFAMPPLSEWRDPLSDHCMNPNRIEKLIEFRQNPLDYTGLLHACILNNPELGPNGALLVALLASRMSTPLRMWLNDIIDGEHYQGTIPELRKIASTLSRIEPEGEALQDVAVCDLPFPRSLEDLRRTLALWSSSGSPTSRIAFLDPDRYRIERLGAECPETCSHDRRLWLEAAAYGVSRLALAIHFTGHRFWESLKPEIVQLRQDAEDAGYHNSITFSHGYYTATASIMHRDGEKYAEETAGVLKDRITKAWQI